MPDPLPPFSAPPRTAAPAPRDPALFKAAQSLESAFLAEMLRMAGAGRTPEAFGGGIGEAQFASFLGQAQAEAIVKTGGIGLAEKLYAQLKERADGR